MGEAVRMLAEKLIDRELQDFGKELQNFGKELQDFDKVLQDI